MRACVILLCNLLQVNTLSFLLLNCLQLNLYYIHILLAFLSTFLIDFVKNIVNYASCLHVTYIANDIRIIIILFCGHFHLQMNKTSVTTLYLYAFIFTLSAWLCDVTFPVARSCTLVGCDTMRRSDFGGII